MTTATKKTTAGSLLPMDSTTAGLLVGAGVGLAMSANTGDGKTLGDRAADIGEWAYNGTKDLFKGIFS